MIGTMNSVVTVAPNSPPMTARPSGAFCSPPSPRLRAIGSMPSIMADAVIRTGRIRAYPADSIASRASGTAVRSSFANVTSRMLFAVATPIDMMEPISDGTLNVVSVTNNVHRMPAIAPGSAVRIMNGSSHDWKFTAIRRYTRTTANMIPSPRRKNEDRIVSYSPRSANVVPRGRFDFSSFRICSTSRPTLPRSRRSTLEYTSNTGATL